MAHSWSLVMVLLACACVCAALFCDCCDRHREATLEAAQAQSACLRSCLGVGTPEFEEVCARRCFDDPDASEEGDRACCGLCGKPASFWRDVYAECCRVHEKTIARFPEAYTAACERCKQTVFRPVAREMECCNGCAPDAVGCCGECGRTWGARLDHGLRCCTYCGAKYTSGSHKEAECCDACLSWV